MMGIGFYKVSGDSMLPCYRSGDFVLTYRCSLNKLKRGDAVVVNHNHFGIIIKRINGIDGLASLTLIGDNFLQSTDTETLGEINFKQVLGKVIFHITAPC